MNPIHKVALKTRIETEFMLRERLNLLPPKPGGIWKKCVGYHLSRHAHMIDAGAHIGADSIEFARLFPEFTIHAFEPIPAIYERLVNNTRHHRQIHCYPYALSGRRGVREMHISNGASDASSSLLAPKSHLIDHPDVYFVDSCAVECETLDGWALASAVKNIEFLWLDLQGCELEVLRASPAVLAGVRAIHTEVSVRETYSGGSLYPDLKTWLQSRGFVVKIEAIPAGADMGNVLFVREPHAAGAVRTES
jgi:FkbM family methyltransferase